MKKDYTKPFQWLIDDRYRIGFHVAFWIFIYLDEILSFFSITPSLGAETLKWFPFEIIGDLFLVYVNLYLLIPKLLLKNKLWKYLGASTLFVLLNLLLMIYLYYEPPYELQSMISFIVNTFVTNASLVAMAVCIKIFKIFTKNRERLQDLQYQNLQSEISLLKSQVNPHFLFNALNSIHVLSRTQPKSASEAILQLSDLMRYQIYDCNTELIPIKNEIEYLENYLALEKMRKNKASIIFETTGQLNGVQVAPLLFIPFVENAIKHGVNIDNQSSLKISINIDQKNVNFYIENDVPPNNPKQRNGGIGLANVKRRLELIYPKEHQLTIKSNDDKYIVILTIPKRSKGMSLFSN